MSTWNPPGPLPEESAFVVQARDSIPPRRTTTTATTTARGRGRGRTRAAAVPHPDEPGSSATGGRGRKKGKTVRSGTTERRGSSGSRARGRGVAGRRDRREASSYPAYRLMFGEDGARGEPIPDLNLTEEIPVSQNAPGVDI